MTTYNVKDFGARGDGIHDDKEAIQQAIDAAWETGGGTVYIPEGMYSVSGNSRASKGSIILRDNVTVEGAGMGNTIIRLQDGWDQKLTGIMRTKSAEVSHDIILRDLTIDGNMQNNTGEVDGFFTGVTPGKVAADQNILVERVEIHSVSRYGFDPHEQTIGLTIRDSVAHDNGKDGFVADFLSYGIFENNISYGNGRHGFNVVTGSHDFVLKNNIAYDNGDNGIVVQRGSDDRILTDNILIEGGKVYGNGKEGVLIKISTNVTLRDAEIFDNGKYGLRIAGSENTEVTGNKIYNNSQAGNGKYDEVRIEEYDDTNGASGGMFYATGNVIKLNMIYADGEIKSAYSVREDDASSKGNVLIDNLMTGSLKGDVKLTHALVENTSPQPAEEQVATSEQPEDPAPTEDSSAPVTEPDANEAPADTSQDTEVAVPVAEEPAPPPAEDTASDSGVQMPVLYASIIEGNAENETLTGTPDNDLIMGAGGNDTLEGYRGDDFLAGGSGNDSLVGTAGHDILDGGEGMDILRGGSGNDALYGGEGNDRLNGNSDNDELYGGGGQDTVLAGSGDDTVSGGNDDDYVIGHGGDDVLLGGAGNDRLSGGTGNDTIYGGGGDDMLWSGKGQDVFVFVEEAGADKIRDFDDGLDVIDLSAFGFTRVEELVDSGRVSATGEGVELHLADDITIQVKGLHIDGIDNEDFIF